MTLDTKVHTLKRQGPSRAELGFLARKGKQGDPDPMKSHSVTIQSPLNHIETHQTQLVTFNTCMIGNASSSSAGANWAHVESMWVGLETQHQHLPDKKTSPLPHSARDEILLVQSEYRAGTGILGNLGTTTLSRSQSPTARFLCKGFKGQPWPTQVSAGVSVKKPGRLEFRSRQASPECCSHSSPKRSQQQPRPPER